MNHILTRAALFSTLIVYESHMKLITKNKKIKGQDNLKKETTIKLCLQSGEILVSLSDFSNFDHQH